MPFWHRVCRSRGRVFAVVASRVQVYRGRVSAVVASRVHTRAGAVELEGTSSVSPTSCGKRRVSWRSKKRSLLMGCEAK